MDTSKKRSITASFFLGYFNTLSSYQENCCHSFGKYNSDINYIIGHLNFFRDDFHKMINSKNNELFFDFFNQSGNMLDKDDLLSIADFVKCNYFDINYVSLLFGEYLALIDFDSFEIFDETKLRLIINEIFTTLDLKISWKKVSFLTHELNSSENLTQRNAKDFIFGSMLNAIEYNQNLSSKYKMPTAN